MENLDPKVKELLVGAYELCLCPVFIDAGKDCQKCDAFEYCDLSKWLQKFKEVMPYPEHTTLLPPKETSCENPNPIT